MELTFFGTSHGVPEANRRCSSIMVTVGENVYFIDMGTDAAAELRTRGIDFRRVKTVFITHMHGDHTNGLIPFIDLCSWYFREANPMVYLPSPDGIAPLRDWLAVNSTTLRDEITFKTVEAGTFYDDGVLRVTAFRTLHCAISYAYLLEADGKRVLCTGDLCHGAPEKDFPVSVAKDGQHLDVAVCESAHFDATKYAPIFAELSIDRVYINHYQPVLYPGIVELGKMLAPVPVTAATDGLIIRV